MSNGHQLIPRVEGKIFTLERIFDAPRELVFKAFSEAEHLKRWWGPKGWSLPVCNIDFRPGGIWHYCMKCTDGSQEYYGMESWGKAIYHEIIEPERITFTDVFSDADGNTMEGMPETFVTMNFIDYQGKTKIVSEAHYTTEEGLKTALDMGMLQGITETWDNLAAHLKNIQTE